MFDIQIGSKVAYIDNNEFITGVVTAISPHRITANIKIDGERDSYLNTFLDALIPIAPWDLAIEEDGRG